jgi:ribosome recycling factor
MVMLGGGEGGKEGGGGVGEDEVRRNSKMIEAMTEEWVKKAGEMLEKKKKEILTV